MAEIDNGLFLQNIFSLLLRKIVVPGDYHSQVDAVKQMQQDDVSGLVDSLTDFYVNSASVDYRVETGNENLNEILDKWLKEINIEYNGKIPIGIGALAEEYFKERWKYSSFPVLKIAGWRNVGDLVVPSKLFFVDGQSIYAKDKDDDSETVSLINYDYFISKKMDDKSKLDKGAIFSKPFARWFDKYPIPFLIKRGIYHNYRVMQSLKNNESQILDQVIPYLLLIKKNSPELFQQGVSYSNEQLQAVIEQVQELVKAVQNNGDLGKIKSPIRATQFDEEWKHIIPDLKTIFDPILFEEAERNILAGLGFIDVVEGISSSRRESILNPKACIEEIKKGVKDFKQHFLSMLVYKIKEKNESHSKFMNEEFYVTSSPVRTFMTNDFKQLVRVLYDRGRISSQTAVELIAEVDFKTEVYRREREEKNDISRKLYPPVIRNDEDKGIDLPDGEIDDEEIPEDKKGIEKENYNNAGKDKDLVTAPYTLEEYPTQLKNLPSGARAIWIRTFNAIFKDTGNEDQARRGAWHGVKLKYKKQGKKWVRKKGLVRSFLDSLRLNKSQLEEDLEEVEKDIVDAELKEKQIKLLDKLNKEEKDDKIVQ